MTDTHLPQSPGHLDEIIEGVSGPMCLGDANPEDLRHHAALLPKKAGGALDEAARIRTALERRLRDRAARLGYQLRKARTRVQESPIFGTYMLVDPYFNAVVAYGHQDGYGLDLDEIEELLAHEEKRS